MSATNHAEQLYEAHNQLDMLGIENRPLLAERLELLCDYITKLKQALAYYTEATVVADWGMQELAPDWMVAREALGLPDLFGSERDAALGEVKYFDDGNYNEDA